MTVAADVLQSGNLRVRCRCGAIDIGPNVIGRVLSCHNCGARYAVGAPETRTPPDDVRVADRWYVFKTLLVCMSCSRVQEAALYHRAPSPPATWRRSPCTTCGGSVLPGETTRRLVYRSRELPPEELPWRGRPPEWMKRLRAEMFTVTQ